METECDLKDCCENVYYFKHKVRKDSTQGSQSF